jgi:hypothetical protein
MNCKACEHSYIMTLEDGRKKTFCRKLNQERPCRHFQRKKIDYVQENLFELIDKTENL